MIVHDVAQGSTEWLRLRMGKPTASQFHRIVTAKKGEASRQRDGYCNELLAEMMLGHPLDNEQTMWMRRGHELEAEARAFYEFQTDTETQQVGFCTTDDGRIGASPDSLVGEKGLLEIKSPKAETHVAYLLSGIGADSDYRVQLQGQLYVTGREWVDIISYYPGLPSAIVRVTRDEEYIETMARHLNDFCNLLDTRREKLIAAGWLREKTDEPERDWLGITDQDIEHLLRGSAA